tara:strand:+ start:584 stop:781 length:198 start_codon:yes stop_codon:yes gene_type:complete
MELPTIKIKAKVWEELLSHYKKQEIARGKGAIIALTAWDTTHNYLMLMHKILLPVAVVIINKFGN